MADVGLTCLQTLAGLEQIDRAWRRWLNCDRKGASTVLRRRIGDLSITAKRPTSAMVLDWLDTDREVNSF